MRALLLGDLHCPWIDKKAVRQALDIIPKLSPDLVIQMGDGLDQYSFSAFARSVNVMTARDELKEGHAQLAEIWDQIRKKNPNRKKARHIQLRGNHDIRAFKRVYEKYPEIEAFLDFNGPNIMDAPLKFDGVELHDEIVIDDILFQHGYRSKLGDHATYNRMSTCVGHSHRGGLVTVMAKGQILWELNAGYLADPNSTPLKYRQQKWVNWTHGVGAIDDLGPRFIPFI